MDSFSLIVLDSTLDLAAETMTADRVTDDVKVIRGYMELIVVDPTNPEYIQKLREAVNDLSAIATEQGQFLIAARLESISRQFHIFDVA
jgi:hypothetical protein